MGGDDVSFRSTRLRYCNPERASPLLFEMLRLGDGMTAFLSLSRSHWSGADSIQATFRIGDEEFQENFPILEGRMRLRLTPTAVERVISALQEGREVVILVDGFEERLRPEQFNSYFDRFTGGQFLLNNFLKGPF